MHISTLEFNNKKEKKERKRNSQTLKIVQHEKNIMIYTQLFLKPEESSKS